MKKALSIVCLLFGATVAPVSLAQGEARVLNMQLPVWVERDGERRALRLDRPITAGDVLLTGDAGRLLVDLPDGADLKIGSEARFAVNTLREMQDVSGSLIEGIYEITRGAFRYTTRASGANIRRALSVKVGMATVGIRGTDFWGLTTDEADTVVLLEGAIVIEKDGQPAVEMDEPMRFYRAPKTGPTEPVADVDMEQLNIWAASVEMATEGATLSANGEWALYLASYRQRQNAGDKMQELDALGYPAEVMQTNVDGPLYRVGISGFATREDAVRFADTAALDLGISGAWPDRL